LKIIDERPFALRFECPVCETDYVLKTSSLPPKVVRIADRKAAAQDY